jgi:catechol 2,3-dioxygenase-like lactoylglutathione lyase family enzyme
MVSTGAPARTHISLNVSDIDRSVIFYEAFFGAPAHKRRPLYANWKLDQPPLKFAMQQADFSQGAGPLSHLGFQLDSQSEVDAVRARLIAAGLATFDERDTTCCYALQDKVWVHDPDGNAWEVYVLLDELDEDDHHAAMPVSIPAAVRHGAITLELQPTARKCCS